MICAKGQPLKPEIKQVIVALKDYFDRNKSQLITQDRSTQMVADALDIGIATVNRVMASYRKNPQSIDEVSQIRGKPSYSVDASHEEFVRAYIRQSNIDGSRITLEMIQKLLLDRNPDQDFHVSTLGRTLDRWGFEFGKGTRTQHLKEKDHVVLSRQKYLRRIRENRENSNYAEVYLDESYVNKNHSNDFIWYFGEDGPWVQKPTGKGERLIIMNAITKSGWVPGAQLVFKSTRKTGDYHGQMNAELFQKWFKEKLLPNIPKQSLIIMDNASYHNALSPVSAPLSTSSKAEIRQWLESNGVPCKADCLKVELVEVLKKVGAIPIYAIDEIAKAEGHEIIRTPPYHPELQPIETCWGIVKNEVARHCDFTMDNLHKQLGKAFAKVTSKTCLGLIKKVRKIEDRFWEEDALLDQKL